MIAKQPAPNRDEDTSFEAVYRRHERDVVRYATLMLRDPEEARDVASDTFRHALEAWRDGRGPAGRPLPWLLTIARRLVSNRWRRKSLIRWIPLAGEGPRRRAREAEIGEVEFWLWLDSLARAIPDRQREVLILRYRRDLTDQEIGEVMGLTGSGVRSLVARALESLRHHPELLR